MKAINRSELDKNCAVTVKNGELKFYGKRLLIIATVGYNVYVMSGSKAPDFDAYGLQKLIDITVKAPDKVVYI